MSTKMAAPELPTLNLEELERLAVLTAITQAPSVHEAAALLGITRHALRRRRLKLGCASPPRSA